MNVNDDKYKKLNQDYDDVRNVDYIFRLEWDPYWMLRMKI